MGPQDFHAYLDLRSTKSQFSTTPLLLPFLKISGTSETSIPDDQFDIFVYNPLGHQMSTLTRFPVPGSDWSLFHNIDENKVIY